jgi:hypothetical protein
MGGGGKTQSLAAKGVWGPNSDDRIESLAGIVYNLCDSLYRGRGRLCILELELQLSIGRMTDIKTNR